MDEQPAQTTISEANQNEISEKPKPGFLDKIKGWFSKKETTEEYETAGDKIEEAAYESGDSQNITVADDEAKKDLAASMKITLTLMQKLPEHELEKFKRSQEFQQYKELLTKYKIKKL